MGSHDGDGKDAGSEDEHVLRLLQFEGANAADEDIADRKVEKSPIDVDGRGRKADPGRGGEGALEGVPRDAIDEMGDCVRQERAAEEIGNVMVPAHVESSFIVVIETQPLKTGIQGIFAKFKVYSKLT